MSCYNCNNCVDAAPFVPECADNEIRLGYTVDLEFKIVRVTNVASGAITEYVVTPELDGEINFFLSDFDVDLSFWQSGQGRYAFELIDQAGGEAVEFTATTTPGATSTYCVLVRFTPLDNVTGQIQLDY